MIIRLKKKEIRLLKETNYSLLFSFTNECKTYFSRYCSIRSETSSTLSIWIWCDPSNHVNSN